jgi:TRAP-type transport system periplasmic protein
MQGVEKSAELVKQKSGGKLKVNPFPGSVLGPDLQVVATMQGGTVEMNVMNASLLAGNVKEMALWDMPYLFNSTKEADAVADGPIGRGLLDKLQERGLVGLAVSKKFWDKLSADEKKILQDAATETALFQRKVARDEAAKTLEALKKAGMVVHELPPAEMAKLRERGQPVADKFTQQIGADLVKQTRAQVESVRAGK